MLEAGRALVGALMSFEYEAAKYRDDPLACLYMDGAMGTLSNIASTLVQELEEWEQAIGMIANDTQIAPESERGYQWRSYLSARQLMHFATIARSGDRGYIPQLMSRLTYEGARDRAYAQEMASACGRPTTSGRPCKAIPVYWPGLGRDTACSRHLTPKEKDELLKIWKALESRRGCSGCGVLAGVPCDDAAELIRQPTGELPRVRQFAGLTMHDVRLKASSPRTGEPWASGVQFS